MGRLSKDKRDVYYREAKREGFRARSAFKLLQIDRTIGLLNGVRNVADLCAAPGGWSQVLAQRLLPRHDSEEAAVASADATPRARIVAVDKYEMEPIEGVIQVQGDITHAATAEAVLSHFAGERADLVVCDGAPDVTFRVDFDEYVQHQLLLSELALAVALLRPGGAFLAKVFRGEHIGELYGELQRHFREVICCKPRASRNSSQEVFVACRDFAPESGLSVCMEGFHNGRECNSDSGSSSVRFVACGGPDDPDADRNYPVDEGHTVLRPVAPPIAAPYHEALEERRVGLKRPGTSEPAASSKVLAPSYSTDAMHVDS